MDDLKILQRKKRDNYFLKGPVHFGWIRHNIPDPTSRLILVAQAFMLMQKCESIILSLKIWACADIQSSDVRVTVLKKIRKNCEDFEVETRKGKTSVLKIKRYPEKKK